MYVYFSCSGSIKTSWTLTAATRLFSVMKVTHSRGSVSEHRLFTLRGRDRGDTVAAHTQTDTQVCRLRPQTYVPLLPPSATDRVESWDVQARRLPEWEKHTLCTHPPPPPVAWVAEEPPDSNNISPNGILLPQGVGPGFSSTSLM